MKLIMLCGQGGAGKSTYGTWLVKQLNNAILLRMDDVVKCQELSPSHKTEFFELIYNTIYQKKYDNIILDFSHDGVRGRALTLDNSLKNIYTLDIDFITISLRPGYKQIYDWKQTGILKKYSKIENVPKDITKYFTPEQKLKTQSIYEHFQYPIPEEFQKYNFKSTTHIIIDNSKPYERLFW